MILVTFASGEKDFMDLKHFRMNEVSVVGCNYIGRLQNDPTSSLAVTGCLNKPGDKMEVTLVSKKNKNKMFLVDFERNTEILRNFYEEEGICNQIGGRIRKNE